MKIGSLELKHGIFLAPLAGVTDHPFRELCVSMGAECVTTEMISAKALCFNDNKTKELGRIYDNERPAAVQIFGSDPETMAVAAKKAVELFEPSYVDINMGCPVPKVFNNGEGSGLMKNPALCGEIVYAVKNAVNVPVTVKIRTGVSPDKINGVEVALECEKNGADCVFVHGRTRAQMYSGQSDPGIIAEVKKALTIPVVANGDIISGKKALEILDITKADGIMIARGAMGNPWIFKEIICALEGKEYTEPTNSEKRRVIISHIENHIKEKTARALPELRKHLSWYIHGAYGSAAARAEINSATTREQFVSIVNRIFQ